MSDIFFMVSSCGASCCPFATLHSHGSAAEGRSMLLPAARMMPCPRQLHRVVSKCDRQATFDACVSDAEETSGSAVKRASPVREAGLHVGDGVVRPHDEQILSHIHGHILPGSGYTLGTVGLAR